MSRFKNWRRDVLAYLWVKYAASTFIIERSRSKGELR
jgi:hypothetical protein